MRIALAQTQPGSDRKENLRQAVRLIHQAADEGAGLVVFPELALDRFFPQHPGDCGAKKLAEPIPGPTTRTLSQVAHQRGIVIVFNLYEVDEQGRYFDTSPVIDADGTLLGVTRMVHITDYPKFHERGYYHPGDRGAPVYPTRVGRVGVAICYDRHYPEYMRALGVKRADMVVIPQAGAKGEWPDGLYEGEIATAAFQNGYFVALCNRVGLEDELDFCGESFVVDPSGVVIARAPSGREALLLADCDLDACQTSAARTLFLPDRRPDLYGPWLS